MLWFLERDNQLMACEVRRAPDGAWEYEVTAPAGETRTERFDSPTPLLDGYLRNQQELMREGWRPRGIC
jgi:hypothetical protein